MSEQADIEKLVARVAQALQVKGHSVTCAESCTGGWIAKVLTDRAGSSAWFDRGFVTYSNLSKQQMLAVPQATLEDHGAVSRETVVAMVKGALKNSVAEHALAVSGIAGPGGGSEEKPVGTVWIAWGGPGYRDALCTRVPGDREAVRFATVRAALSGLLERLE